MFEFHKNRKQYFEIQVNNAAQFVIPFIEQKINITPGMQVLEIGCGEGGVLKAFINKGCLGVGVELDESRLVHAREWLKEDIDSNKIQFISKDIYQVNPTVEFPSLFDIIILKDVIEHIHDQKKLMGWMQQFLKPGGAIYFGFPPWQMPFGGHQQLCRHSILSKLPYYHLLPTFLYKFILSIAKQPVADLLEIKETGISIEKFEKLTLQTNYKILHNTHYLINPIYEYKFNLKPKIQFGFIKAIPWVRNFFTTCVYYLITPNTD
jgi:2-polyprenyl-3-methyl-5-hydroxy-6-metoxy-1,4-benzoquinol methylase